MKKFYSQKWLRLLIPLGVTILILYFSRESISFSALERALARISAPVFLAFALFSLTGTALRWLRFSWLLSGKIPYFPLFLITLVQNFSVDLLPARTAALALYAYYTHQWEIKWSEGTASYLMSVMYDALAVGILLTPSFIFIHSVSIRPFSFFIGLSSVILLSIGFIVWAPVIIQGMGKRNWIRWPKLVRFLNEIEKYLQVHSSFRERALMLLCALGIKAAKYISLFILFSQAASVPFSLTSFFLFSFGIAAAEISAILPVQGIAGFGTWEAAFAFVVTRMNLPIDDPFSLSLAVHFLTQAWEYTIGLLALFVLSWENRRKKNGL